MTPIPNSFNVASSSARQRRSRRVALLGLLVASCMAPSAGCGGGGMSASDMRKYAIKRTSTAEEERREKASAARQGDQASDDSSAPAEQSAAPPVAQQRDAIESKPRLQGPQQRADATAKATAPVGQSTADETASANTPAEEQGTSGSVSDTKSPPESPLSPAQRAAVSAANIERIAAALQAYREHHGTYPARAYTDRSGGELLSWRVALLPFLGYEELHEKFQTAQPWFSAANKALIDQIPSVYQSPERFDEKTNYLAVTGGSTVFASTKPSLPALIEDGPENTVFVVEADDALSAPWTKPQEYPFSRDNPLAGLGTLRTGHFFVAWGGGNAAAVPTSTSRGNLIAMFTADAGESFSSFSVSMPLDDDLFSSLGNATPAPVASASPPNQPAATNGSATEMVHSSARAAPAVVLGRGLAAEYANAARTAFQVGEVGYALRWYYASRLLQPPRGNWDQEFRWAPALRRPSPTVHFCIGLRKEAAEFPRSRRSPRQGSPSTRYRDQVFEAAGQPGERMLEMIEGHAQSMTPPGLGSMASAAVDRRGASRVDGAITYLQSGTRTDLMQRASRAACDVLVMIESARGRTGAARSLEIEFYDFVAGRRILTLPRLNWIDSAAGEAAIARDPDYRDAKFRLEDLLRDELTFTDWPSAVTSEAAVQRVVALGRSKAMHPLQALAEMNVYRARGLISGADLLDGMRAVCGEEAAEEILLGDDRARRRLLRQWLPSESAEQLGQRNQRRRDEDDD